MQSPNRPVIALDIKLKHYRSSDTNEVVGVEDYVTSFAFRDRYEIFNRYVDALCEAGALPLLVPCFDDETVLREYLALADGFLFVGINDYPPDLYREPQKLETVVQNTEGYRRHAASNMVLARLVLQESGGMPALGICAGPQLFTIALGGKLVQHVPNADDHIAFSAIQDKEHEVTIAGGRVLSGLFGEGRIVVNTNHHQAPDPEHLGEGLQAVAFSDDGVVEAVEATDDRFVLGVQWHPERISDAEHRRSVFSAFVQAANEYRRRMMSKER